MSFSSRLLDRVRARSTAFTLVASAACAAAVFACGGISDPTKEGEKVATVSGSLTGTTVPAGARVALVWRTASSSTEMGGYALGDDVPVVSGKFSISLAVPASAYFSDLDGSTSFNGGGSVDIPPSTGGSEPPSGSSTSGSPGTSSGSGGTSSSGGSTSSSSSGGMEKQVTPKDMAGGSVVTQPLSAAVAGFVVYVDTNGNGKLDLSGQWASSSDTVIGGAKDLVLTYLKDGGKLDYEKLRDSSSILPAPGFNLAWTEKERWLPLDEVELKLDSNPQLPYPVCSTSGYSAGSGSSSGSGTIDPVATPGDPSPPPGGSSSSSSGSSGTFGDDAGTPSSPYPDPADPNLRCSADGTSFSYSYPSTPCPTDPTPPPAGLCAGDIFNTVPDCATGGGYGASLPTDGPVPEGWPCMVAKPPVDGGSLDGGSADGG